MKTLGTISLILLINWSQAQEISTFILVRHSEKEVSEDRNPPLSEKGNLRAQKLNTLLESVDVDAIYTTDYIRTKSTVEPLANSKEITPRIYNPSELSTFGELLTKRHVGQTVLVSGHSNTTPALLNVLAGSEKFEALDEKEYDWVYIVDLIDLGNAKVKALKVTID